MFQGAKVVVEASLNSDHAPLIIALLDNQTLRRRTQNLKYKAHWGKNKECKGIIKQVWRRRFSQKDKWQNFNLKVQHCKGQLKRWQCINHGRVEQRIMFLNKQILDL